MIRTLRVSAIALIAIIAIAPVSTAAETPTAAGTWEGQLAFPGATLDITVVLRDDGDGVWSGTIDIPQQNAIGLALGDVLIDGDTVAWTISGVPGDPTFIGALSEDGNTISGTFSQGATVIDVTLTRKDTTAERRRVEKALDGLAEWIDARRADWKVPGASVVIVKDDRVVFLHGFGDRNVAEKLPVTPDTQFAIGSCSKAFTAVGLQILADDGKLDWDAPVRTYLKDFELHDPVATLEMTPRDLVTHRSGLPRHDLAWYGSQRTRQEIYHGLRDLKPTAKFRTRFQYNNLMFMTAGYLAGEVAGTTWEDFTRKRILDRIGMTAATLSVDAMQKQPDYALPYSEGGSGPAAIPFRNIDAIGPAGSINASAREMAQWVRLHLNDGQIDGKRVYSREGRQLHTGQVVMDGQIREPEIGHALYAMGWMVNTYRGDEMITHGGAIDGFSALVAMVPKHRLGIVVLTNMNGTSLPPVVAYQVADRIAGREPVDWQTRLQAQIAAARAAAIVNAAKRGESHVKGTKPSHGLKDYAATFVNGGYGKLTVTHDAKTDALSASFNGFETGLAHWHYDTFSCTSQALGGLLLTFHTREDGTVDRVTARLEPTLDEHIAFAREP